MARIRNIKPRFFVDSDIAKLSPYARLFFIGLWCLADREGRLEDKPEEIMVQVMPYDAANVTASQLLNELTAAPAFIIRYEVKGKAYIEIKGFKKHQRPSTSEPASTIPAPPDILATDLFVAGVTGVSKNLSGDEQNETGKEYRDGVQEGKGLAAEAADGFIRRWPDNTDNDKIIALYIKSELPETYERASQEQVNDAISRFSRPAAALLRAAGGLDTAVSAFAHGKAYYDKRSLSWTLDTIAKNAAEFVEMAIKGGAEYGVR